MTIHLERDAEKQMTERSQGDVILSVQGVSKKFCRNLRRSLFYGVQDIAKELTGMRGGSETLRPKEFWALKDVSFELRRGEALGLVGKNGSGKTTLLRIIAGLIRPDTGSVEIRGRVAPLIALGAGFNPILTGRENIYANMSILGLTTKEIEERFDAVVEFAEIGEAIDAPVQSYSSGMAARLGFASAIHTEPEILLIDEVLAVGDSRFQGRCFKKLHELRKKGTAFILVSHNSHVIMTVCDTAVYLAPGSFKGIGDVSSMINQYEKDLFLGGLNGISDNLQVKRADRKNDDLEISSIFFRDFQEQIVNSPMSGEATYLCIEVEAYRKVQKAGFTVVIKGLSEGGEIILRLNNVSDKEPFDFYPGKYEVQMQMPHLGLKMGAYVMDIYAKEDGLYHLDSVESFPFSVQGEESVSRGVFYQPRNWRLCSF